MMLILLVIHIPEPPPEFRHYLAAYGSFGLIEFDDLLRGENGPESGVILLSQCDQVLSDLDLRHHHILCFCRRKNHSSLILFSLSWA
jgi:hypothetical protein